MIRKVALISDPKYVNPEDIDVYGSTSDTILFGASSDSSYCVHISNAGNYFQDIAQGSDLLFFIPPRGLAETPPIKPNLDEAISYNVYKVDSTGGAMPSDAPPRIIIHR